MHYNGQLELEIFANFFHLGVKSEGLCCDCKGIMNDYLVDNCKGNDRQGNYHQGNDHRGNDCRRNECKGNDWRRTSVGEQSPGQRLSRKRPRSKLNNCKGTITTQQEIPVKHNMSIIL